MKQYKTSEILGDDEITAVVKGKKNEEESENEKVEDGTNVEKKVKSQLRERFIISNSRGGASVTDISFLHRLHDKAVMMKHSV